MPSLDDLHAEFQHLEKKFGKAGMQAIATLMHDMGSGATIHFDDNTWFPCDFMMQAAWKHGGAPDREEGNR